MKVIILDFIVYFLLLLLLLDKVDEREGVV